MNECHHEFRAGDELNNRCPECDHLMVIHDHGRKGGLPVGVGCVICHYKTHYAAGPPALSRSVAEHDHLGDQQ